MMQIVSNPSIELKNARFNASVSQALTLFKSALEEHFGENLKGLYLFGSYARGDFTSESDVDVAVVLTIAPFDFWHIKRELSDLAYDIICETEMQISAFPFTFYNWENPNKSSEKNLITSIKADAKELNSWLKL